MTRFRDTRRNRRIPASPPAPRVEAMRAPTRIPCAGTLVAVTVMLAVFVGGALTTANAAAPLEYLVQMVASQHSGDCKAIADYDGDGKQDLAVGGYTLVWYRAPAWTPMVIATAGDEYTTDMETADLDGDGDADLIVPDGTAGVYWFENQNAGQTWTRRFIGASGGNYTHDVEVGDIDGDGDLDVVGHPLNGYLYVYRNNVTSWSVRSLVTSGGEGLDLVDLDLDGRLDLVTSGQWHRAPAGDIITSAWPVYVYDSGRLGQMMKVEAADINGDGRPDIVVTPAESTGEIAWLRAPTNPLTGTWVRTVLRTSADHYHSLILTDLNGDGWLDIVTAQMHTAVTGPYLEVYLNGGAAVSFERQVLASASSHNMVVGDLNNDGRPDLAGCNYIGNPPVRAWMNQATYASAVPTEARGLVLSASPNPFNARINVTFDAPAGAASLSVYDLMGRRVRELWTGEKTAGPTTLVWDGRDDAGALAASGVYHVVLASQAERQAQAIMLVK